MKVEFARISSAKVSLEEQLVEVQSKIAERDDTVSKQALKISELEEALSHIQMDSERAASEQISAKSAGDSQVALLNSRLKVSQASLDEKQSASSHLYSFSLAHI